jgi:SRSO17 transposase
MLERALDAGMPAKWVTADEAYGKDSKFRLGLQRRHVAYVLAVACNQKIPTETGSSRADTLAARAPDPAWKRRSCGDGVKGPRHITLAMWAHAFLAVTAAASKGAASPSGTNSSLSPSARSDVSWHT